MTQFAYPQTGINSGYLEGQDGWKAGADFNWAILHLFTNKKVANATTNALPGSPVAGDAFIVGDSPTGALAGKENYIYVRGETGWHSLAPVVGWRFYNTALDCWLEYNSSVWAEEYLPENVTSVATIDMGADDYTMTRMEAAAACKVLTNVGDGTKIISFNSDDIDVVPKDGVIFAGGGDHVTVGEDGVSSGVEIATGEIREVLYLSAGLVLAKDAAFFGRYTGKVTDAISQNASGSSTSVWRGALVHCAPGTGITLTLEPYSTADMPSLSYFDIVNTGAGTVTLSPGAGVTLSGVTSVATNGRVRCYHTNTLNTWVIA
jgi:hypothetical protein